MNKLKIGYLADGIWGHNAFKLINADDNFEICFITPRFDTTDETLKNFATENNIAYLKTKILILRSFCLKLKNIIVMFWFQCHSTKFLKNPFCQNTK